ncbi:hypothetical protein FRC17_007317, partial [Serendipita sp. 399]
MSTKYGSTADSQEEWIPLAPKSDRPSRKTRKESRFKVGFLVVAPIVGYIILAVATATIAISVLHHRHFRINDTADVFRFENGRLLFLPLSGLRQSDVTTLVSLASTLTRFLGSVCCGIACWRAAYILLEREGLTLADIDGLVSRPFLRPWPWGTYRIMISCFALLFLSAELYSPILNGSLSWKITSYAFDERVLGGVTKSRGGWWLARNPSAIYNQVYRAVVYTTMATVNGGNSGSGGHHTDLWRVVDATRDLPINTTLANITLPFFVIDSFEWIMDPDEMLDRATLSVTNADNALLNLTSPINPMKDYPPTGYVALLPKAPLNKSDYNIIQPTKIDGSYYVAMMMGEMTTGRACEEQTGFWFDYAPPGLKYRASSYYTDWVDVKIKDCIAFARVSIRAGAGRCTDCRITNRFTVRNESQIELQEDYMTHPVIHMMPEVSLILTGVNTTLLSPERISGLDRYITDTLTQAYCGTWTSLTEYTAVMEAKDKTAVRVPVQVSEVTVDRRRVIAWLLLNTCVAACCVALVIIQASTGKRRVLVDATLAALLLDSTEVVDSLAGKDNVDVENEEGKRKEGRD